MYTTTADFSDYQNQLDGPIHTIVEVTDGTSTWYFSTVDIDLTDGHVDGLLLNHSGISESVSLPFSRKWAVGDVTVTLSNRPYKRIDGAGTFTRVSEELADIRYNTATIYLRAGNRATALSGCVTRFVGKILYPPSYTDAQLQFVITDNGRLKDVMLPQTLSGVDRVPVVYGVFDYDGTNQTYTGKGLAKCIVSDNQHRAFKVADHALDALTEFWATDENVPDPVQSQTRTLSAAGATVTAVSRIYVAVLWPAIEVNDAASESIGYVDEPFESITADNVIDRDPTTSQVLHNNKVAGVNPGTAPEGILLMTLDSEGFLSSQSLLSATCKLSQWSTNHADANTIIVAHTRLYYHIDTTDQYLSETLTRSGAWVTSASWLTLPWIYRKVEADVFTGSGLDDVTAGGTFTGVETHKYTIILTSTGTPDVFSWQKDDDAPTTSVGISGSAQTLSEGVTVAFAATTGHTVSDQWVITARAEPKGQPYAIGLFIEGKDTDANGNLNFINIFGVRLLVKYGLRDATAWWAECQGREYDEGGAWIGGRSSNYAGGDVIEDPAGIIESICRDELGLVDADLDLPSFVTAENTTVKARINLHSDNMLSAFDAIQRISEQSTLAFFFSGSGKARVIDIDDKTPTTDRTIVWSRIVPSSIRVYKANKIINHLTTESRWQQEYSLFRDINVTEDATSQATHGTFKYAAQWSNVAGTSESHLASFLVNAVDGIWSTDHSIAEFESQQFTNADIEIGDWIELDATTVDPHLKCFGSSWSGKQLLVIGITQRMSSTKFKAIELF